MEEGRKEKREGEERKGGSEVEKERESTGR